MEKGKYKISKFDKNYDELLKLGNLGLWMWDLKSNRFTWSPSTRKIRGLQSKVASQTFEDFIKRIYPDDRDKVLDEIKSIKKEGRNFFIEYRMVIPGRSMHWLEIRGKVMRDLNRKPTGMHGVFIDITKRKAIEKELKETASQLHAIFTSVPEGITVESRRGKILYCNEAVAKLFNFKSSVKLFGLDIKKLFTRFEIRDQKDRVYKPNQMPASEVFRGKKHASRLFSFRNRENEDIRWLKISATPVESEGKPTDMVIKVFQDVTNEIEEQLNTQNTLGMVSHELKNALASVRAYIQLIGRRIKQGDIKTSQIYVQALSDQSDRVIKIINDLMDVTRIRAGLFVLNKRKFNYTLLLDKVVDDFKKLYPGTPIRFWRKNPLFVYADEDRIVQVLINLVSNAVRYSAKGKPITISAYQKDDFVITNIKDRGIGIPKKLQPQIFKLFSRMENHHIKQKKGLGMGLFISNAIIMAHEGTMGVISREGKGSMFSYKIPAKINGHKK